MEKITLTMKAEKALKEIALFYDKTAKGWKTAGDIFNRDVLQELKEKGLVFKTKEGWFPSTRGYDYLNFYGRR